MNQSIFAVLVSLLLLSNSAPVFPNETKEIHVLIDVSGSMKQNDPKNHRVNATQLLINLMPDGSKAYLWLFSEKTELLSHTESIDDKWRKQALKASQSIHSRGIYTDIEGAIGTVLKNGFADNGKKNLILLTDGMVDISPDIMVSADSRERILSEWIPRLRQHQLTTQTIALSDQADKELLEKLAFETSGWSETAQSAEQLERLFLRIAQKISPKDTVPLTDNQFSIDSHIQEFSVLVFKKTNASPIKLITPDQKKIGKGSMSSDISWLETTNYALITIKQPTPGDWQLDAATDADNQVLILTDLKLKMDDLPNFASEQDQLPLRLYFTDRDNLITQNDFLELVTVSLSVDHQEPSDIIPVSTNEPGYYAITLSPLATGKHTLRFIADGKTFKREIAKDIEVLSSPILVKKLIDSPNRQVTLKFEPDTTLLDSATLSIIAVIHQDDKLLAEHSVSEQNGEWLLELNSLPLNSTMQIHFNIMAKTLAGEAIKPKVTPITINESLFSSPEPETSSEESQISTVEQTVAPINTEKEEKDAQESQSTEAENSWSLTIVIVVLANLMLCGIGYLIYKLLKSTSAKKQQQLLERLG